MWTKLNANARLHTEETVPFTTFNLFEEQKGIKHGFSTRLGGVSTGIFASMNLGLNRGDAEDNVKMNFQRFAEAISIPYEDLVFPKQTHSCNVRKITRADAGNGLGRPIPYDEVDAMITNEPGLPLLTFASDCVPVFFYDPKKQCIAVCHAGWRGTIGNIVASTCQALNKEYGSEESDLLVVIGPSICGKCFEIGPEVAKEFLDRWPDALETGILRPGIGDRYFADLWKANEDSLLGAGISERNLQISGICTMCHQELYFSHRGSHGQRGGNAGVLMLTGNRD